MHEADNIFPWGDSRRFNSYKRFLAQKFGTRIQKLTIDAGFSCPNRDGTVGTGGCTYCLNDAFNPSYCSPLKSVRQQIDEGIEFHRNRYRRAGAYLAYFQAFSNTHAPLAKLKEAYAPALSHPDIAGIVIGTRPDCIDDEKLDYFEELSEKMFISIEYGVESCNDRTLEHINRGHTFAQAAEAIKKTNSRGIHTGAHFIFGLPNETTDEWMHSADIINSLNVNSVKFHQLQIIKNTSIEKEYLRSPEIFHRFTVESYIDFITEFISHLNPEIVIERFAGEVPPRFLSVSDWGTERYDVILQRIERMLEKKGLWQGKYYKK